MIMKCKHCGSEIPTGMMFCPSCGGSDWKENTLSHTAGNRRTVHSGTETRPGGAHYLVLVALIAAAIYYLLAGFGSVKHLNELNAPGVIYIREGVVSNVQLQIGVCFAACFMQFVAFVQLARCKHSGLVCMNLACAAAPIGTYLITNNMAALLGEVLRTRVDWTETIVTFIVFIVLALIGNAYYRNNNVLTN